MQESGAYTSLAGVSQDEAFGLPLLNGRFAAAFGVANMDCSKIVVW
jgi:hypothetical protein